MDWNGQRIRDLRRKMGWSQSDLVRRLNCSTDELSFWEDDKESPPAPVINQLTFFAGQLEERRESLEEQPLAEIALKQRRLEQINSDEL